MGGKGKFIPDREESTSRKAGSLQDPKISLATPGKFFGISGPGFTKENELFVGRVAQLGFAASLIGEAISGQGSRAVQPRDRYSTSRRASSPLLHRPPRPHRGKRGNWKVRRRRVNSSIHYIIFAIILLNPQAQSKVCSIVISPTFLQKK